jgi:hypothetical protein
VHPFGGTLHGALFFKKIHNFEFEKSDLDCDDFYMLAKKNKTEYFVF